MAQVPEKISVSRPGWRGMFTALGIRVYRLYLLGTVFSYFGGQMQGVAQAWLAYELNHSPLMLTLVMAMQAFPMLAISLFSGVVNDRIQKRNIIILTQCFSAVVNVAVATLVATGHIQYWHLLAASFLTGVNTAFSMPARYSIVPELVSREKIYNAVAINNGGSNIASIAGPAIAGILIATIGTAGTYYIGAFFGVISIIITAYLPATSKLSMTKRQPVLENLTQGLTYLRRHNFLLLLISMELIITIFGMSYQGLIPVFAELLGQQSEGYGFMMAAIGIGAVCGSLVLASLGNFKRKWIILGSAGVGVGIVLILFANSHLLQGVLNMGSGGYFISILLLIMLGYCANSYASTSNTILQMSASEEYRGRMNSVLSLIIGVYPLSSLGVGALANYLGAPLALTITGSILTIIMLCILLTSRRLRNMG